MNRTQYKKARKILAANCKVKGRYVSKDGECAIGALALAAGVKPSFFTHGLNNVRIESDGLGKVREAILSKFGLAEIDVRSIQWTNDRAGSDKRRLSVLHSLDEIAVKKYGLQKVTDAK